MAKVPGDHDLNFWCQCTKEEFEPLAGVILGTDDDGNIDHGGCIALSLEQSAAFRRHWPDPEEIRP